MPSSGLSLIGFASDQQIALNHLRHECVSPTPPPSDAQLIAEWQAARVKLGTAFPNTGNPQILPISASAAPYIANLVSQPWLVDRLTAQNAEQFATGMPPAEFKLIEIDPLLAFQMTVDMGRTNSHCSFLNGAPTESELLGLCLPSQEPQEAFTFSPVMPGSSSVIIKLRNHNLRLTAGGIFDAAHGAKVGGGLFQVGLPFIHVTRYNGRCYLHNGFHRSVGIRAAGGTHAFCIFRDVSSPEAAGVQADGKTFTIGLLESGNPPTLGHFTQNRAVDVNLRHRSRVLHMTWHEYSVIDEYDG